MCSDVFGRSLTNPSHPLFSSSFRRCIRLSASQPSPQRPCSSDARHPQASHWTRIPPACSAAPPSGRLDQGRWCPVGVANEAAYCCPGGGRPESRDYHRGHLSFSHDVRWANWGKHYQECYNCSDMLEVSLVKKDFFLNKHGAENVTTLSYDSRYWGEGCHLLTASFAKWKMAGNGIYNRLEAFCLVFTCHTSPQCVAQLGCVAVSHMRM